MHGAFLMPVNRLKVGWSKFVDKVKSKKAKKKRMKQVEQNLVMRFMAIHNESANEEGGSSREGSIISQEESDRVTLFIKSEYSRLLKLTHSSNHYFLCQTPSGRQ